MAHELAHIQNRDTLIMTITATFAGAIGMLGSFWFLLMGNRNNGPLGILGVILAMIVAPLAASIVQMAISRTREYAADRRGAEICGNPEWLADALAKIQQSASRVVNEDAERSPATAHMFIINPLNGQRADKLFSTHPRTENRIRALMGSDYNYSQSTQLSEQSNFNVRNTQQFTQSGPWSKPNNDTQKHTSTGKSGPWG